MKTFRLTIEFDSEDSRIAWQTITKSGIVGTLEEELPCKLVCLEQVNIK